MQCIATKGHSSETPRSVSRESHVPHVFDASVEDDSNGISKAICSEKKNNEGLPAGTEFRYVLPFKTQQRSVADRRTSAIASHLEHKVICAVLVLKDSEHIRTILSNNQTRPLTGNFPTKLEL